jgi:hypothetical protein
MLPMLPPLSKLVRRLLALSIRVHSFAGFRCESAFALNTKEPALHEHFGKVFPPSPLLQLQNHHLLARCTNKKDSPALLSSSLFMFWFFLLAKPKEMGRKKLTKLTNGHSRDTNQRRKLGGYSVASSFSR